jgi:hypothetical protein
VKRLAKFMRTAVDPDKIPSMYENVGLFYDSPARLQGVWGRYNKWLATTKHVGAFEQDLGQCDGEMYTDEMDYVIGASMFVDKAFI